MACDPTSSTAGGHGPIRTKELKRVMCSDDCVVADKVRTIALATSNCSCVELSTRSDTSQLKYDYCRQNSGELAGLATVLCPLSASSQAMD